jgi:hypothetical protein
MLMLPPVETGASEFDLDLGGVPLSRLMVRQGAGKFELDFSVPNPHPMELFDVSSGAAGIELENLANANFGEMRLSGGAAGYELDFGGVLLRDAQVTIETGMSGVEVSVPASTAARIVAETTLGSVDVGAGDPVPRKLAEADRSLSGKKTCYFGCIP